MPRVKNAYKCSRCEDLMPSYERTSRRVRMVGSVLNIEYNEDLCKNCALAEVEGRETRPVRTRSRKSGANEEAEPESAAVSPRGPARRARGRAQSSDASRSDAAA